MNGVRLSANSNRQWPTESGLASRPDVRASALKRYSQTMISRTSRLRGRIRLSASLTVVLLMLSACSAVLPLKILTEALTSGPPPPNRPVLPSPEPAVTNNFTWKVIRPGRLPEGDQWVLFALTPRDYEILSENQAEALRWAREASWLLRYYSDEPITIED